MMGVDPNDEVRETIINYVEEGCPDVDQVSCNLNWVLKYPLKKAVYFECNYFKSAYDITQLAKPLDLNMHQNYSDGSNAVEGEFPPAISKQKPGLQEMGYIRRGSLWMITTKNNCLTFWKVFFNFFTDVPPITEIDGIKAQRPQNTDVGDFINSKLREIDNDPVQPPYDSLQEYAYEGEGSMYGSTLSSLDTIVQDEKANSNTSTFKGKNGAEESNDTDLDQLKSWGPKFNKISNIYGLKSKEEES